MEIKFSSVSELETLHDKVKKASENLDDEIDRLKIDAYNCSEKVEALRKKLPWHYVMSNWGCYEVIMAENALHRISTILAVHERHRDSVIKVLVHTLSMPVTSITLSAREMQVIAKWS